MTTESVTLAIAVLGAVLGIINTWSGYNRDRLKLRVTQSNAFDPRSGKWMATGVSVINLSAFPVTIEEVGFHPTGNQDRFALFGGRTLSGEGLPARIESREAITFYVQIQSGIPQDFRPYCKTGCNNTVFGKRVRPAQSAN